MTFDLARIRGGARRRSAASAAGAGCAAAITRATATASERMPTASGGRESVTAGGIGAASLRAAVALTPVVPDADSAAISTPGATRTAARVPTTAVRPRRDGPARPSDGDAAEPSTIPDGRVPAPARAERAEPGRRPPRGRRASASATSSRSTASTSTSRDGEFFSMLGPSGCGKTTTLRMIAGFELPDRGPDPARRRRTSRGAPPYERDVNTVFQDYALFPHMTVVENVALRADGPQGAQGRSATRRVAEALEHGPPRGLRRAQAGAALRRPAAARRARPRARQPPAVLLLDEPLGALDLKLREEMQIELKRIQQRGRDHVRLRDPRPGGGAHDERPDRRLQPRPDRADRHARPSVYERPATEFVAGFVGSSNLLERRRRRGVVGERGTFTVRPEKIRMAEPGDARRRRDVGAPARIREVVYLGPVTRYLVALDGGGELVVTQQNLETSSTEALARRGDACGSSGSGSTRLPISG